jgi:hypothetical protein
MEQTLIRIEKTEDGITYVHEQMMPQEVTTNITLEQHEDNVRKANEKLENVRNSIIDINERLIELEKEEQRINVFLDQEVVEIEVEEDEQEETEEQEE